MDATAEGAQARRRRRQRRPHRSHRHHQSARNHPDLGPRDRRAHPQGDRVARSKDLGALRRAPRSRAPRRHAAKNRFGPRSLLFGHQDRVAARQRRRRSRSRRSRRARLRHHRLLPGLQAVRRRGACHRRQQRLAHPLDEPRHAGLGQRDDGSAQRPGGDSSQDRAFRCQDRHHQGLSMSARRRADHGHRRRSASRALRTSLFQRRRHEMHLWHRGVRACQYRQTTHREQTRAAHDGRMAGR